MKQGSVQKNRGNIVKRGLYILLSLIFLLSVVTSSANASQSFDEYPITSPNTMPLSIISDGSNSLWYLQRGTSNAIARMTTSGAVTDYSLPNASYPKVSAQSLVLGTDGNPWFIGLAQDTSSHWWNVIGKVDVSTGGTTVYPFQPQISGYYLGSIGVGPDGNLWFIYAANNSTGPSTLYSATLAGTITSRYTWYTQVSDGGIVTGSDGRLWVSDNIALKLWAFTVSPITGAITASTSYTLPSATSAYLATGTSPDGNIWFANVNNNKITSVTPTGTFTEYTLPSGTSTSRLTAGPDGALWFTDTTNNKVGRMTTTGSTTLYSVPTANSGIGTITAGPDNAIWFTEVYGNKIGRLGY